MKHIGIYVLVMRKMHTSASSTVDGGLVFDGSRTGRVTLREWLDKDRNRAARGYAAVANAVKTRDTDHSHQCTRASL